MGQKAKNAGNKKTKQFEAKLATAKSLSPTGGACIRYHPALNGLNLAALSEQQRS